MIMTNRSPASWRELEELVSYYFNNSGYKAITPYEFETVRGKVEVDVYVMANNELGQDIVCECKFWDKHIPKEKIHAFRTVVNDLGVNVGMIISKSGFQEGAYIAASSSNIKLLTWDEFLGQLFDKWFKFRKSRLLRIVQPLAVYTDPIDVPIDKLNEKQKEQYKISLNKYIPVYMASRIIKKDSTANHTIRKYNDTFDENVSSYEEFFDSLEIRAREAIKFYEKFFSDFEIEDWKFDFNLEKISELID